LTCGGDRDDILRRSESPRQQTLGRRVDGVPPTFGRLLRSAIGKENQFCFLELTAEQFPLGCEQRDFWPGCTQVYGYDEFIVRGHGASGKWFAFELRRKYTTKSHVFSTRPEYH
jgi:hypothetical protein